LLRAGGPVLPDRLQSRQTKPALMVLDDDPLITKLVALELGDTAFQVLTTNDPGEAFELLARQPVGVVLCDQSMPKLTGTEFLCRVGQLYPNTVRILFSAYRNFELATEAINLQAAHRFLYKPLDPQELRNAVAEAFAQHARASAGKAAR
jgi:DNA-binding NtrC family response regulator